jgi:hypothetical protein
MMFSYLFTYGGQLVVWCLIDPLVDVVHYLLARHEVPDTVARCTKPPRIFIKSHKTKLTKERRITFLIES